MYKYPSASPIFNLASLSKHNLIAVSITHILRVPADHSLHTPEAKMHFTTFAVLTLAAVASASPAIKRQTACPEADNIPACGVSFYIFIPY